jgi:hypothetical protein
LGSRILRGSVTVALEPAVQVLVVPRSCSPKDKELKLQLPEPLLQLLILWCTLLDLGRKPLSRLGHGVELNLTA